MPFYRVNGMMVHMRGTKLPLPCRVIIKLADGRKEYCAGMSGFLCDWPAEGSTCSMPLCADHALRVGKNKDYCPQHAAAAERAQPGLFTGLVK